MQENKVLVKVPFTGFYCTVLESLIDGEINQYYDWYAEENGKDIPEHEINYRAIFEYIAKKWCFVWSDSLFWEMRHNAGIDDDLYMELSFESLQSPKYYNFETDKIYAYCAFETLEKLYNHFTKYGFKEWLWERMRPCSGFIPHYSNCLEDWGNIEDWDYNQWGLFLEWLDRQYLSDDYCIYEDLLETIQNAVWENIKISETEND